MPDEEEPSRGVPRTDAGKLDEFDQRPSIASSGGGRSSKNLGDAEHPQDEEEEDTDLDFSGLRACCHSLGPWCRHRCRLGCRATIKALKHEFHQGWGRTPTAKALSELGKGSSRRRLRTFFSRSWSALGGRMKSMTGGTTLKRKKTRKKMQMSEKPTEFGLHCFVIHNPGKIEDYFDVDQVPLGSGGTSKVFLGSERMTHVDRAIKRITVQSTEEYNRYMKEISIMKSLDNPNVVKLYETFEDSQHIYLVLELCQGGDVLGWLQESGALSEYHTAVIVRTVCSILNYLNSNGIVHRDIKPENLLLKDSRRDNLASTLRLADYGYACRERTDGSALETKVGSPLYVAPEVLTGSYNRSCDIWSVGVVCYLLLCGYPPFFGPTDAETLAAVKNGKYIFHRKYWTQISHPAKHVIKHLLKMDPDERFSLKKALSHPWVKARGIRLERLREETVDRLITFHQYNKLRRCAAMAIAYQLEPEEMKGLRELFQSMDMNGDGLLTQAEFTRSVSACGVDESFILEMMESVDADQSGTVDFSEFLAATLEKDMYIKNYGAILRAFRTFDQDDSGQLTKAELAETLCLDGPENEEQIARIFADVDLNGDGYMDFQEFYQLMTMEVDPDLIPVEAGLGYGMAADDEGEADEYDHMELGEADEKRKPSKEERKPSKDMKERAMRRMSSRIGSKRSSSSEHPEDDGNGEDKGKAAQKGIPEAPSFGEEEGIAAGGKDGKETEGTHESESLPPSATASATGRSRGSPGRRQGSVGFSKEPPGGRQGASSLTSLKGGARSSTSIRATSATGSSATRRSSVGKGGPAGMSASFNASAASGFSLSIESDEAFSMSSSSSEGGPPQKRGGKAKKPAASAGGGRASVSANSRFAGSGAIVV